MKNELQTNFHNKTTIYANNKNKFEYGGFFMQGKLKNIEKSEVLELKNLVSYQDGQVVSKTLVQNSAVSITLFAFEKGEEISSHKSDGDAMVTILEGTGKITIGETAYVMNAGETIVMPANVSHAVYGEEKFKMLLTVVF